MNVPYPPQIQNSYAGQNYPQASVSQGMNHSVFPMAQPGTYASYTYPNPNNQQPSSGTPWWVWALICLLIAAAAIGGIWYYLKHKSVVVVPTSTV